MTTWSKPNRKAGAAAMAAALVVLAGPTAARAGQSPASLPSPNVSVVAAGGGTYRIEGSFRVDTSVAVAWAVLTDYNNLPSFVSSIRSSAAVRDPLGRLLVTQDAVGRLGPFSRGLQVELEVREEPQGRIAFRDVGGTSFRFYTGRWEIAPEGPSLRIEYALEAHPRSAPPLFARSILASNARSLLEQVRREMQRRTPPSSD